MRPFALAALALSGCGFWEEERPGVDRFCEPGVQGLPCRAGVEEGVAYRYRLFTHCGIEWAYFDGRYWVPRTKMATPRDWAGNAERGTMTLLDRDAAVFEGESGGEASFRPAPDGYRPPFCA